jgi:hypothetical protein
MKTTNHKNIPSTLAGRISILAESTLPITALWIGPPSAHNNLDNKLYYWNCPLKVMLWCRDHARCNIMAVFLWTEHSSCDVLQCSPLPRDSRGNGVFMREMAGIDYPYELLGTEW